MNTAKLTSEATATGARVIKHLKDNGFSIIVNHFRDVMTPYIIEGKEVMVPVSMPSYEIRRKNLQGAILSRGGYTTVKATKKGVTVTGEAKCHPSDSFNRSFGLALAAGEALKQLHTAKLIS